MNKGYSLHSYKATDATLRMWGPRGRDLVTLQHTTPPTLRAQDPQQSRTCSVNSMTSGSWLCLMKSNNLSLVTSPSKLLRPSSNCGRRDGREHPGAPAAPSSPGLAVWQPPSHLGVLRATGCREQHFPGTRHQRHQGDSVGLSERLQRPAPAQNTPSPERAVPLDGSGMMRAVPTEGGQPGLPPPGRRQ